MRRTYLTIASLMLIARAASAQDAEYRANTRGLFLNAHTNGASIKFDEKGFDPNTGGGVGFQVGYGITRMFTLYAGSDASDVTFKSTGGNLKYWLKQIDAGARVNFVGPQRTLVPYLDAGASRSSGGDKGTGYTFDFNGIGWFGGVGVQYYWAQKIGIDLAVKYSHVGNYDFTFTFPDDPGSNSKFKEGGNLTRVELGVSWYPQLGR